MLFSTFLKIVLLLPAVLEGTGEYCRITYLFYKKRRYCEYGCCVAESDSSEDCCPYSTSSLPVPVAVSVGTVLGCVAGFAILIGIIRCCCVAINNRRRHTRTVLQPTNIAMQPFVGK